MSGHHRRGSDPESPRHTAPNSKSNKPSPRPSDLLQRHWSIADLSAPLRTQQPHGRTVSAGSAIPNLEALQAAWSSGGNFLGGDPMILTPPPSLALRKPSHSKRVSSCTSTSSASQQFQQPPELLSTSLIDADGTTKQHPSVVVVGEDATAPENYLYQDGVSSVIHDAARITDWDRVLDYCNTQPEAAAYAGNDGWTALHHACNRRCPRQDVVRALIQAYPQALLQEEEGKSWLPLHFACRFKAPRDVVALLLHIRPGCGKTAVQSRDIKGRRPLYYAIRYDAPPGVAELLIAVDPSAILDEDQNEESPLALVWDSWAEKLEGKRIVHSFLPGGFPEPEDTTPEQRAVLLRGLLEKEPKLKKRWNQVNVLLGAAFGFPFQGEVEDNEDHKPSATPASSPISTEQRTWRIVHATAAVKCHISLFLLACALHPEQARELDEYDLHGPDQPVGPTHQTALHLAASSKATGEPGKTVIYTLLSYYREAAEIQDEIDGSLPLHRMVENPRKQDWPNHAAILYHFYQRAVQIQDRQGKLPLHRAAAGITHETFTEDDHEEHSVIIQLVRAYPQAASQVDNHRCLPMHYLAQHARVWDDDVEAVHNAHRVAAQARAGPQNALPLHMAAANPQAELSLIQRLVTLHPRAAAMETRDGKLPFHIACEQGKPWSSVKVIYDAFVPAMATAERNARGWTALHMASACPKDTAAALISEMVQRHPEMSRIADHHERFPLHLACSQGKSWLGGLQALFDAHPSALLARDEWGCLPFHICALAYCRPPSDDNACKTKAAPKAEAEKEMHENNEEAAQLDILFQLLRADPTTLTS